LCSIVKAAPQLETKFTISVQEITDALNANYSNPLEKLICNKILALFHKDNITIAAGSLVYDMIGDQIEINSDCSHTVWMEQGWETTAKLKPDTAVTVDYHLDGLTIHVEADLLLDCNLGVAAHLRLREGVHDPFDHNKCKDIAVETTHASVSGDLKLQTNVSLLLKPSLVETNGTWGIHYAPTVTVAGELVYFHPTASSDVKIFGIDITFIEDDINKYIERALQDEVTNHQVQEEFANLQVQLQALANRIWPAQEAVGALPGITQDYLTLMAGAIKNVNTMQNNTA